MKKKIQKSKVPNFFINAFYESKFKDNLFVIKAGGKIIEDDKALDNLISNISDLTLHGIKVLLVYGGGRALDEAAAARKIPVNKKDGRRLTDRATMDLMKEVVGGTLSLRVNESMARCNLPGVSLNAVPADWMRVALRPKKPIDYGFVGDVQSVQSRPIARMFKITNFVACACLGITQDGVTCNINADTIATELAIGAKAHKLIFLSDVDGVDIGGKTAFMITAEEIPGLIKKGIVKDGMRVKMESCQRALDAGVRRIHLISGLRRDSLKKEIYEPVGPGTMLIKESERQSYMNEVEAQKVLEAQR
jgi:acetylglutamate kinase